MWALLICSLLSVTISIERIFFWLRQHSKGRTAQINGVMDLVAKRDYQGAIDICKAEQNLFSRVLLEGLQNREHGLDQVMQIAADREIEMMKCGLSVLDTIITMAPLLGILGTVLGIIDSFNLLGEAGIEDPKAVTGGIAQALITTATGLTVALATLIPFNFFTARTGKVTRDLETVATELEVVYRKSIAVPVK